MDNATVNLFSSASQTGYEDDVNALHEKALTQTHPHAATSPSPTHTLTHNACVGSQEAQVSRQQELYTALTEESAAINVEMDNIVILRGRLEAELQQTAQEHAVLGIKLSGV